RGFNTVVDLRSGDYESVSRQPHTTAQHRWRKLKYVGVKDDSRKPALVFGPRRGNEHAQRRVVDDDIGECSADLHLDLIRNQTCQFGQRFSNESDGSRPSGLHNQASTRAARIGGTTAEVG